MAKTPEEIKKAIEELVSQALASDVKAEPIAKASVNNEAQNGGKDEIQSGSPKMEHQVMKSAEEEAEEEKKKKEMEKAAFEGKETPKEEKEGEEVKKAEDKEEDKKDEKKDEKKEMEKAEDKEEDKKEEKKEDEAKKAEDKEDEKEEKKEEKQEKCMKKSIEELAKHLTEDELELVKAWREENEEMTKAEEPAIDLEKITKAVEATVKGQVEELKKSLDAKDSMIKSLSEKVEKMASQPAYTKRSVSNLEVIEKGEQQNPTLQKAQVLQAMLDMQREGKEVTSMHVAEFEATGNISNPRVKSLVINHLKNK